MRDSSKAVQIRNLLIVFGTGVITAVVLALGMLYYYNPAGSYAAGNVLLSPEQAALLQFNEGNVRSGTFNRFTFAGMDFSYFDHALKKRRSVPLSMEKYKELYDVVAGEQSIADADDGVKSLFSHGHPSSLTLKMSPDRSPLGQTQAQIFLQIDFIEDYYRILLRDQAVGQHWVYFYHPGIEAIIKKLSHSS